MKLSWTAVCVLLVSPMLAEQPAATVVDNTGTTIALYGAPLSSNDRESVAKDVGEMRRRVQAVLKDRDVVKVLDNPEVRSDILKRITAYLGGPGDSAVALEAYAEALDLPSVGPSDGYSLKRVYVYDQDQALSRAKKGDTPRYLAYDKKGGSLNFTWTPDAEAKDMPVVLLIRRSRLISFDSQAKRQSARLAEILEAIVKDDYSVRVFSFTVHVISRIVDHEFPQLPRWYREGLVYSINAFVLNDLIGQANAIKAFNVANPPVDNARPYRFEELLAWDVATDPKNRNRFVRASTAALLAAAIDGKTGGLNAVMKDLRSENPTTKLDSNEIFERFTADAGVDLKGILVKELARVP